MTGTDLFIGFTGHRPPKIGGYGPNPLAFKIRSEMESHLKIIAARYKGSLLGKKPTIVSGMALGVDTMAAQIAFDWNWPLKAMVPGSEEAQRSRWPRESQEEYQRLLRYCLAGGTVHVTPDQGSYRDTLMKQKEDIVKASDILIAIWDGSAGGTHNCVQYARKQPDMEGHIIVINPRATTLDGS